MTPATFFELLSIADSAAAYITKLNGESSTFEIGGDTLTAVIAYETEIEEDGGDYWTAPSWSIQRETVRVESVCDETGDDDAEAARLLEKQLN